ncbi:hypothetical protein [Kitasatospora sp. NBC_00315]|uniref:hypothetical protein n=1 Tax=Kitasatospora sp. NBC_00315 TaxID=2975963 RepID=UPI003245CEAF
MEPPSRHGPLRLVAAVTTFATAAEIAPADIAPAELEAEAVLPADRAIAAIPTRLRPRPGPSFHPSSAHSTDRHS